jgi:hypothetical protein
MTNTNTLILTTCVVAAGTTLGAQYLKESTPQAVYARAHDKYGRNIVHPKPPNVKYGTVLVAAVGLGLFLSLSDIASDDVTRGLCYLIIIGAVLTNGGTIANTVNARLSKKG